MNFNSLAFLIFLPIVLILYWIIPPKGRWVLLLAASYYFYMSWNPGLIFLILGTTASSFLAGKFIERTNSVGWKKFWLILSIVISVGSLIFFKYFNFLIKSVIDFLNLFSLNLNSFSLNIILPVGISFYTFQTLSYVIEVYKGKYPAERHVGYYALYVCYFPQLVAGPIERPQDLIPQLKARHVFNLDDFIIGLRILLVGFFYKCVIADVFGIYVNRVFSSTAANNSLTVFIAGFLFSVQIYCDFAGYSEIAIGSSRMMGIKLSRNFNRPYLAKSGSDFFKRWHITLTRWLTQYIYIPLGGSRKGTVRRIINTILVFLLCGLWHGANWTYVIWGLYAAIFLILEVILSKPLQSFTSKFENKIIRVIFRIVHLLLLYLIIIISSIIFRASDLTQAINMLKILFTEFGFGATYFSDSLKILGIDITIIVQIVLCCICGILVWNYAEIGRDQPDDLLNTSNKKAKSILAHRFVTAILLTIAIGICWIALLGTGSSSAFQYFQF